MLFNFLLVFLAPVCCLLLVPTSGSFQNAYESAAATEMILFVQPGRYCFNLSGSRSPVSISANVSGVVVDCRGGEGFLWLDYASRPPVMLANFAIVNCSRQGDGGALKLSASSQNHPVPGRLLIGITLSSH